MWQLALGAMLASAAIQNRAAKEAADRQRAAIQRSLEAQQQFQMQAEQRAMETAKEFDGQKRIDQQEQIANELEAGMIEPVAQSQDQRLKQQEISADTSETYSSEKAAAQVETMKSARAMAKLMAKTTSADRLRMGETFKMMDAGQDIDRIGNFSRGQHRADAIGIEEAGRLDPKKVLLASLLNAGGQAAMFSGMGGGGAPTYSVNSTPTIAASPGMAPVYDVNRSFMRGFN